MDVWNKRYSENFECYAFLAQCSALDPRFKLKYIKSEIKKEATKQALELECGDDDYNVIESKNSVASPLKKSETIYVIWLRFRWRK